MEERRVKTPEEQSTASPQDAPEKTSAERQPPAGPQTHLQSVAEQLPSHIEEHAALPEKQRGVSSIEQKPLSTRDETIPAPENQEEPAPALQEAQSRTAKDQQRKSAEDRQLKSAIESLLFIAGNPLSLDRLKGVFEEASQGQIEAELDALRQEYEERESGIMLAEVAGGYQLVTRPENAVWIRKFRSVKVSSRLSRPALETLAIVAYKQPITRAEIEAIRGVNIGGIIRNLMERRLVKIVGKKDVPGKPMMYGTTLEFLQYFGLKDLSSLPTLKEFQELDAGEEIVEETPVGDANATTAEDEAFLEAAAAEAAREGNVSG